MVINSKVAGKTRGARGSRNRDLGTDFRRRILPERPVTVALDVVAIPCRRPGEFARGRTVVLLAALTPSTGEQSSIRRVSSALPPPRTVGRGAVGPTSPDGLAARPVEDVIGGVGHLHDWPGKSPGTEGALPPTVFSRWM